MLSFVTATLIVVLVAPAGIETMRGVVYMLKLCNNIQNHVVVLKLITECSNLYSYMQLDSFVAIFSHLLAFVQYSLENWLHFSSSV